MNKHYTFEEYLEKFPCRQDSYDYYFELQKEIDRLTENNLLMQEEMDRTWEKLNKKENIIKEVRKYLKEREDDNNMCSVCGVMSDRLLEILDKENNK